MGRAEITAEYTEVQSGTLRVNDIFSWQRSRT
jgi:hypothetical protein